MQQQLGFAEEYGEVMVLDATNEDIRKALESGEELVVKGDSEQDAILCTATQTFQLFSKETSNELLFVRNKNEIDGCAHQHLEPVRIPPRLDQLKSLLEQNTRLFNNDTDIAADKEEEDDSNKRVRRERLTLDKLVSSVQASKAEILAGMKDLFAYEDSEAGWVTPNRDLMGNVIQQFLLCLVANSLENKDDIARLQPNEVCGWLSEFPAQLITAILFVDTVLNIECILQFKAETLLLQQHPNGMSVDLFMTQWHESIDPLTLDDGDSKSLLREFSLISNNQIRHFSRNTLPRNAKQRLQLLFDVMPFWIDTELDFYLMGVEGGAASAIARFCRMSKQGEQRGYIKRML